jgi:hypothetical protein
MSGHPNFRTVQAGWDALAAGNFAEAPARPGRSSSRWVTASPTLRQRRPLSARTAAVLGRVLRTAIMCSRRTMMRSSQPRHPHLRRPEAAPQAWPLRTWSERLP